MSLRFEDQKESPHKGLSGANRGFWGAKLAMVESSPWNVQLGQRRSHGVCSQKVFHKHRANKTVVSFDIGPLLYYFQQHVRLHTGRFFWTNNSIIFILLSVQMICVHS